MAALAVLAMPSLSPAARETDKTRLETAGLHALTAFASAVARGISASVSVTRETAGGLTLGVNVTTAPGRTLVLSTT